MATQNGEVMEKIGDNKMKSKRAFAVAEFIEDMGEYMKRGENESIDGVLKKLEELHQRYKIIESTIIQRRQRMLYKLPDLKNSLVIAEQLAKNKANVMLEYEISEAIELLTKNITGAEKSVGELADDLDFVKDQLTTTEVNIARVYNYGVQLRKAQANVKA